MEKRPLVSVAIPFYNAEIYLSEAIRSVLNQTYTNLELLLLNDGSKDRSLEIARSFTDERIKIFSDGENHGLVARLNQSVELACGKFYARMDADDIMHPRRIEQQVKTLSARPGIDVLGTSYYSIDSKNKIKFYCRLLPVCTCNKIQVLHPSVTGKRSWFLAHPYDSRYVRIEDTELWIRVIRHARIENLPAPLMFYREFGVPSFKKYMKTQVGALRLYTRHPCYRLSGASIKNVLFVLLKMSVCCLLGAIGKMNWMIKLRRKNKSLFDKRQAETDLTRALAH